MQVNCKAFYDNKNCYFQIISSLTHHELHVET